MKIEEFRDLTIAAYDVANATYPPTEGFRISCKKVIAKLKGLLTRWQEGRKKADDPQAQEETRQLEEFFRVLLAGSGRPLLLKTSYSSRLVAAKVITVCKSLESIAACSKPELTDWRNAQKMSDTIRAAAVVGMGRLTRKSATEVLNLPKRSRPHLVYSA